MVSTSRSAGGGGDSGSRHCSHESDAEQRGHREREKSPRTHGRHRSHESDAEQRGHREREKSPRKQGSHHEEEDRHVRSSKRSRDSGHQERHHESDGSRSKQEESPKKRRRHNDNDKSKSKEKENDQEQSSKRGREDDRRCNEGWKERDQQPGKDKERDQQPNKDMERYKLQHSGESGICSNSTKGRVSRWDEKPPVQTKVMTHLSNETGERCIVLHNVFDASVQRMDDFYLTIRDHFLGRSARCGAVHHVFVDRKSGCVYMLLDTARSANKAAAKWDNSVYEGNLINISFSDTSKYESRHQVYANLSSS